MARWKDNIPGGKADGKKPSDFPDEAMEKGRAIELEHTGDPEMATEITMDHLMESVDYYKFLEEMEKQMETGDMEKKGKPRKSAKSKYPKSETEPYNPWAVCTDSTGREDKDKYERCVKHVKQKNKKKNKSKKSSTDIFFDMNKTAKRGEKNWMQEAVEKPGSFTDYCKRKGFGGVTGECVAEGKKSSNPITRRRAQLAETFRKHGGSKKKS